MRVTIQGAIPYPPNADSVPIRTLAQDLRALGEGLFDAGSKIGATASTASSVWTGIAAQAFGEHLAKRSERLTKAADTIQAAVPILQTFAAAIDGTQTAYTVAAQAEIAARAGLPRTAAAVAAALTAEGAAVTAHQGAGVLAGAALGAVVMRLDSVLDGLDQQKPPSPTPTPTTTPADTTTPNPTPQRPQPLTDADWQQAADALGIDVASLRAVVEVESPKGAFLPDGRPTILFEAHQFSRRTGRIYDQSHPNISSRTWNRRLYAGGAGEYPRLDAAIAHNRDAALQAASWGRFQIMGFNYRRAGYANVEDFVTAMRSSERGQLDAFSSFIRTDPSLHRALQNRDWTTFARLYNGKEYWKNSYDTKIAAAYQRYSRRN